MRRLALTIVLIVVVPLFAQEPPAASPPPLTPDTLWSALEKGNALFVAGSLRYDHLAEERSQLATHQMPPITVLSCADSRVPPELAFNQSLGGLFVVRTAGNVADEFGLASIEFAIAQGFTRLLVVMGHEHCGVVAASLGTGDPGTPALKALAARIRRSFAGIAYDSRDPVNMRKATDANTRASAAQLLADSILIRDAVVNNRVKIVTAYYELSSGKVTKVE